MLINREFDYALRMIRDLTVTEFLSATEIEKLEKVPVAFVRKIAKKLNKAGIMEITRGPKGGYHLLIGAQNLTLLDVSRALEDGIQINECLEEGYQCTGSYAGNCGIHRECMRIEKVLERELSKKNLYDIFEI